MDKKPLPPEILAALQRPPAANRNTPRRRDIGAPIVADMSAEELRDMVLRMSDTMDAADELIYALRRNVYLTAGAIAAVVAALDRGAAEAARDALASLPPQGEEPQPPGADLLTRNPERFADG